MVPTSFDHVALRTPERDRLCSFLLETLGVHEITRGEDFTLLGVDAREGKITVFDAGEPREPGLLRRIGLRVRDVTTAVAATPGAKPCFVAPGGFEIELVERDGDWPDYDLDHVVLGVPDPEATAAGLERLGFARRDAVLAVGDRELRLEPAPPPPPGSRPLLDHLALLVDSADDVRAEAEEGGHEIDKVVDAENTFAVFVRGPDEIVVEYVEHKPGFALV